MPARFTISASWRSKATTRKNPDFAKAADLFKRAAELGDGDAAYSYGVLLRSGRGVPLDTAEGASWIKRAADAGIVAGEVEYAIMLFNGEGVDRDESAAAKLFGRPRRRIIRSPRIAWLIFTRQGAGSSRTLLRRRPGTFWPAQAGSRTLNSTRSRRH